jgi:NADPH:quinone reductase-like Zn-dependent oxidoreductase
MYAIPKGRDATLTGHRKVTAGDTVLTQGSGGVSVFALQFARALGARVIATTSTAEDLKRVPKLINCPFVALPG